MRRKNFWQANTHLPMKLLANGRKQGAIPCSAKAFPCSAAINSLFRKTPLCSKVLIQRGNFSNSSKNLPIFRNFPCIFPVIREYLTQTSQPKTACTASDFPDCRYVQAFFLLSFILASLRKFALTADEQPCLNNLRELALFGPVRWQGAAGAPIRVKPTGWVPASGRCPVRGMPGRSSAERVSGTYHALLQFRDSSAPRAAVQTSNGPSHHCVGRAVRRAFTPPPVMASVFLPCRGRRWSRGTVAPRRQACCRHTERRACRTQTARRSGERPHLPV